MDNLWSNIEPHAYLSLLIGNVKDNKPLNKNDIGLLHLLTKKFLSEDTVTKETVQWLAEVVNNFILVYFFGTNTTVRDSENSKTLLDIVKTACSIQDVCISVLGKLCEKLQECLHELDNERNGADCPSLEITMLMMQITFDSIKKNQLSIDDVSIKEKLVQQSAELLQLEEISDRNFLIANHMLGVVLDAEKQSHQSLLLSSMKKLHLQQDFKKLLLLLAIQAVPMAQSNFIEKNLFWVILQDGLVCPDPLARKRSLYIIKCVLEVIARKRNFKSEFAENAPLISWSDQESTVLWKIWKTFALFCETFEEKQMHVINPVLPLMNEMLKATVENKLHYSWVLVLLNRAMQHESKVLNTWAIHYCLHLDLLSFPMLMQPNWTFVFKTLFESLKNIYLYNKEECGEVGSPPYILGLLENFFKSCFTMLEPSKCILFWRQILTYFGSSTFNEVAMVYITKSLSDQRMSIELQKDDVLMLKDFLITKFPLYKVEYQVLTFQHISQFYCKNMTVSSENLDVLISLLSHAYTVGIVKLDGNCWTLWQNMIDQDVKEIYDRKLHLYLKSSGSCKDLMITLQFLLEHNSGDKDGTCYFQSVTSTITKLPTSPYMNSQTILNSLEFVHTTLQMLYQKLSHPPPSSIVDVVFSYAPPILEYFNSLVKCEVSAMEPISLEILEMCFMVVDGFVRLADSPIGEDALKQCLTNYFSTSLINDLSNGLSKLLENQEDTSAQLHGLVALRMLKLAMHWSKSKAANNDKLFALVFNLATEYARKELAALQKKDTTTTTLNCDAFIVNCWDCMAVLLSHDQQHTFFAEDAKRKSNLLDAFQTDSTIASNRILPQLAGFAKNFVSIFKGDTNQTNNLMDIMWKLLRNQLHSDQTFREIYRKCIEVFFHQDLLSSNDETIVNKVNESWELIFELGGTKPIVTNIAVEYFLGIWKSLLSAGSHKLLHYIEPLVQVAVFGPLRQKREKPYNDLYSYVMQNTEQYDNVENLKSFQSLDQGVRITFTNFILNLPKSEGNEQAVTSLVTRLIERFVTYEQNMSTKCYYPNSEHHRKKVRAWQMILVLLPEIPRGFDYTDLLYQMFLSCKSDNQPSIRYLAEWAVILVLMQDKKLIGKLWEDLENSTEKKIMSVTFILSIAIQLAKILSDDDFVAFADTAVPKILPWAHAHHMTSRLHSHIALQNIWDRIKRLKNNATATALLKEKFYFLEFCFSLTVKNTAGVKHKQELLKTYFYKKFHAVEDYDLKFIFETFLKQHGVFSDEWLDVKHFDFTEDQSKMPLLRRCSKHTSKEEEEENEIAVECSPYEKENKDDANATYADIQKKIMPWNLAPSDDLVLQSELSRKRDLGTSELILCAVLVEKIPNLGGLCRTAEIFGAKQLLIASNRYVSDPGFRSLSVTSEKWIDIEQVLPIKLGGYLSEMKRDGYTIVGVEQTANSQMIGKFKFPKKTVLVLGNEKTGIPVELIQLLDECVEIPQVGIIRSLNVHISGAIMVWEYCKQHSL